MSSNTEKSFYDLAHPDNKGNPFLFSTLRNKVVLIVNTASACGFTPQYEPLEALYQKFSKTHPSQFVVLGFPSNQFLYQEPGTDAEIASFCQLNYGVTFPVLAKSDVNGQNENEVFKWLKGRKGGMLGFKRIMWNFEKFLIGKDGEVVGRWASSAKPEGLEGDILRALEKGTKNDEEAATNGEGSAKKDVVNVADHVENAK
ncbi:MAG: glutathione peroxidase gpx1 [Trichoglossum hirsutum]|nr:MAG: glutathione peroxidase gpx1 [Trichoglossum hirsutum]